MLSGHASEVFAYHSLDGRSAFLDRLENASRPDDGGVEQLLLDVCDVEMERGCRMDDGLEWWVRNDCLVKCAFLSDVFHYGKVELVLCGIRVSLSDLVRLGL